MEYKELLAAVKRVAEGKATVVIATLGVRDKHGDVIRPGFFGQQTVQMIGAHESKSVPIGKAFIYETGEEAIADIQFNLRTSGGKDWYESIVFDYENPPSKQEWSFGYRVRDGASEFGKHKGEHVRFLGVGPDGKPGGDIIEVSPVIRGAGENTRTLAVKARAPLSPEYVRYERRYQKLRRDMARDDPEQQELRAMFERFQARERQMGRP